VNFTRKHLIYLISIAGNFLLKKSRGHQLIFLHDNPCHPASINPFPSPPSVAVAGSTYRVTVPEESVMAGNAALLKCSIPSFVADFLHVVGWIDSEGVELAGGGGQALGNSHHTPCLLPIFHFCV
jgi:hypothetical protein